ncbi:MAG: cytochrome C [Steroidobacteraceae bacterium]
MIEARWLRATAPVTFVLLALSLAPKAHAVPSFARQTGLACEACHTVFPELTHFGRMFKANGYTLDNLKQVRAINTSSQQLLSLSGLPPISVMVQVSETWLNKPLPDGTGLPARSQSSTVGFPQQLSLFYAGKVAPHVGAMIQLTYANDSGTIGIDNTDLRYANVMLLPNDHGLIYGLSVNNNPTAEDLWNSTPAWGFPYVSSNAVVSPLAATQIDGTLGQQVAGLSAYAMWNESLYGEVGVYHSAQQGVTNPITGAAGPLDGTASNVIDGAAPYARIAYEYEWGRHDLEVGAYGASFRLYPGGSSSAPSPLTGPVNQFNDIAEDLQYQFIGESNIVTVAATHIHESMHLKASYADGVSANPADQLDTTRFDVTYYFRRQYGGTLSHFATTGSIDPGLYPASPAPGVITSANGSPDTSGWMIEANYLPWLNTKLSLQYTRYDEFNGGNIDYDGSGRNATANDSTYLLLWLAF